MESKGSKNTCQNNSVLHDFTISHWSMGKLPYCIVQSATHCVGVTFKEMSQLFCWFILVLVYKFFSPGRAFFLT